MTPEQLRAYAAEKERDGKRLYEAYMGMEKPEPDDGPEPWENEVEFEGVTYRVDMRRFKDYRMLSKLVSVKRAFDAGEESGGEERFDLIAFAFSGAVHDRVMEVASEKLGYPDFEEVMRIEGALFEAAQPKN